MKIATEIMISAPSERVWNTIMDFQNYPEWNPFLKSLQGTVTPDAKIEVELQIHGKRMEKRLGTITGLMAPKYFSWVWNHNLGAWFMAMEHVFRLKDKEDGRTVLFQEIFITGLGLKFRRRDIEHSLKFSLHKSNDALKALLEV